jgi:hypothetical protein
VDCWICKDTALGVCRFCGRGVCGEHAQTRPFILDVFRSAGDDSSKALVVDDALFCGECRPHPEPVPLPEVD